MHQSSTEEEATMAQDGCESSSKASSSAGSSACSSMPFRLNVHAREFVPVPPAAAAAASPLMTAAAGYYSPFLQLSGGGGGLGADWNFFAEPDPTSSFLPDFGHGEIAGATGISVYPNPKGASPADVAQKIIKQVWKP